MTVSAVLRVAAPMLALVVGMMSSVRADAQTCRRTCTTGESRDARGCCIPVGKRAEPKSKNKPKAAPGKRKSSRSRKATRKKTARKRAKAAKKGGSTNTGASDKAPADDVRDVQIDAYNPYSPTGESDRATESGPRQAGDGADIAVPARQPASRESSINPAPVPGTDKRSRVPSKLMIGSGVALALGGGVVHALALVNGKQFDSDFAAACPAGCFADVADRDAGLKRAEMQLTVGIGAYVVGGVLAASGLALLLVDRDRKKTADNHLSIVPWTGPDTIGATAGLRF